VTGEPTLVDVGDKTTLIVPINSPHFILCAFWILKF
jgi:hypothetical protein